MKKTLFCLMAAAALAGCQNDDSDFSAYTDGEATADNAIYINYNGTSVSVSGDTNGYVSTSGADVIVNTGSATDSLLLVLSGSTSDGSLLIYRQRKFGIRLNGVSIHNSDGPAINNQCGKSLYVEVAAGTTNTLTDGTAYADATDSDGTAIQQKGALFSEGQLYFSGTGTLNVTGSTKNAIACDDYIVIDDATITATSSTGHGISVNDGFQMNSGTLNIDVTGDGCKGLKNDSTTFITGGTLNISTTGGCVYDEDAADYSSAACIKGDYAINISGGNITLTSSGDGGKGINCDRDVVFSGGSMTVTTTGSNNDAKPKGVKSDTGIIVSGGSFQVTVKKSWACDNGYESADETDQAANCVTIVGTPATQSLAKKSVTIVF